MPIKHIVLLQFKSSLSKSDIEQVMQSLADLQKVIPQIQSFTSVENISTENLHRGFLHGFEMQFNNDTDRQIYLAHPAHIKVAQENVMPALTNGINSALVFDYEITIF